jgi:hypothetical protein
MNPEPLTLIDAAGLPVAELLLTREDDGWLSGSVLSQRLPPKLKEALDWYDEVVENQMLSYLDQALEAVDRFGLSARSQDGTARKVYALHVSKQNEVSLRMSPVPPPKWLPKSESA